ncbi:hypothetical protein AVEN_211971-1 [Araneus ventricosus]|uniref:Uncharacterized protein n=1 Tax=Araneus ventricosus TaxID=182803 RepID=A0A4Y2FY32_ARAVE|nr:hypothetical protein AVEN_211971-1 [Araneus ventricosus]
MGKNKGGIPDTIKEIIDNLKEDNFDDDIEEETRGKIQDIVRYFETQVENKSSAFADDLALVSAGRVREELENNTNKALDAIANKLRELELDLSVDKCQGLAFRSNVLYRQRRGQSIFNRNPIFKSMGKVLR